MKLLEKLSRTKSPTPSAAIEECIAGARIDVERTSAKLGAAVLAAEAGTPGALKLKAEASAAHDSALARVRELVAAQQESKEREEAARQKADGEARQAKAEALRAALTKLGAAGAHVDKAIDVLADALHAANTAQRAVRETGPDQSIVSAISTANMTLGACIGFRLRHFPGAARQAGFFDSERARWAQYLPRAESIK